MDRQHSCAALTILPTPPAPSAKPPNLRLNDLRHRLDSSPPDAAPRPPNRRTPRKWLPRRYRRSSAQNLITGCTAFHLPAWSPSHHAHMRALALAHAQAPTPAPIFGPCLTPQSALDPFIGARHSAGLPRGRRSPGSSPTNGPQPPSDPVKKTYTASSPPIRGELCSSARSHPCDLPSGDSSAALTASRMPVRRPSRPCHRLSRVWPGTYTTWALTCPLAPTIPDLRLLPGLPDPSGWTILPAGPQRPAGTPRWP